MRDYGADAAFPAGELDAKLPEIVAGATELHFPFGREPALDATVSRALARLRAGERRGRRAPVRLVDARLSVHELRLVKSPDEVAVHGREIYLWLPKGVQNSKLARKATGKDVGVATARNWNVVTKLAGSRAISRGSGRARNQASRSRVASLRRLPPPTAGPKPHRRPVSTVPVTGQSRDASIARPVLPTSA